MTTKWDHVSLCQIFNVSTRVYIVSTYLVTRPHSHIRLHLSSDSCTLFYIPLHSSSDFSKFVCDSLHSSTLVYIRLYSSSESSTFIHTCLHSSRLVYTHLVTRLCFQNRSDIGTNRLLVITKKNPTRNTCINDCESNRATNKRHHTGNYDNYIKD